MATRKSTPWSIEEVQTFLRLVADERIQRELDGATRNEKVYQEVAQMLAAHGYHRTFQQCREKLKKLKSDYRSIKDHGGRSGSNRKAWKWFDQMDAIYGHRPVSSGREGGLDSATATATALWSVEEVQTFLRLVADERIQRELDGATRNEKVYQGVSDMLAAHGYQRTFQQCREKLKKMKSDYRSIKDHGGRSGSNRKAWKWFDQMDAIYGHRPVSSGREGGLDSATAVWSVQEVQTFLRLVADERIQRELDGATRNEKVYQEVSKMMAAHGYQRTFQQCREKLKKMKSDYRSIKDHGGRSGSNRKRWKWFDQMDAIYGHRPASSGREGGLDSATALLESLMEDDVSKSCWSQDEVQALVTLWGNQSVQEQLLLNLRNEKVFAAISARLALLGFNKAPNRCREKIKKLKVEYKKIKDCNYRKGTTNNYGGVWFAVMDGVLNYQPGAAETLEPSSTVLSLPTQSQSCLGEKAGKQRSVWSDDEVEAFLKLWADRSVQQQLQSTLRNNNIFSRLSSELASLGYYRLPNRCREKIKKLKHEYKRIKNSSGPNRRVRRWFAIMDSVLNPQFAGEEPETSSSSNPLDSVQPSSPCLEFDKTEKNLPWSPDEVEDVLGYQPGTLGLEPVTSASESNMNDFLVPNYNGAGRECVSWLPEEVEDLVMLWADNSSQEQLLSTYRNEKIFTSLGSRLTLMGYNKTGSQCRAKIKKLKEEYKRIKDAGASSHQRSKWFIIMDNVLSHRQGMQSETDCDQTAHRSAQPSSSIKVESSEISQSGVFPDECPNVSSDPSGSDGTNSTPTLEPILEDVCQKAEDSDKNQRVWLPDEIQVFLTLWAEPNIQEQLRSTVKNNRVFAYISSQLASVGFNKTAHQCRMKVKKLKQEYKKIKCTRGSKQCKARWFAIMDSVLGPGEENDENETNDSREVDSSSAQTHIGCPEDDHVNGGGDINNQESRWFAIMDAVLGHRGLEAETDGASEVMDSSPTPPESSQHGFPEKVEDSAGRLTFSTLSLLVPTLRLMSAFAWQVVQHRNVMHYGKVEELVRLVTEMIPELLSPREKGQLLLGLRARVVLELCHTDSTANLQVIHLHLEVLQGLTKDSNIDQKDAEQLENSKSNFVEMVQTLLKDPGERKTFFKVFPVHYGHQYEAALQTLVWKFISRLDKLLPIPDVKQTAEWLGTSPSVMEECGQLVLEPDQLKMLLHHHHQQQRNRLTRDTEDSILSTPPRPPRPKPQGLASERNNSDRHKSLRYRTEPLSYTDHSDDGQSDHSGEEEEATDEELSDEEWIPEECSKRSNEVPGLKRQQQKDLSPVTCSAVRHTAPLPLHTCSLCPYSNHQLADLLQHVRKEHLVMGPRPPPTASETDGAKTEACPAAAKRRTHACNRCGRVFKKLAYLTRHAGTHTLPFRCDKCERRYSCKDLLTKHQRVHTGERPYKCSHCGRGFMCSNTLKMHVRTHTGDRRYKCHICGKTSIQHLARHMLMHRGEKNYLCTECGKAFLSSGELRLHTRYHTGERPYTCKQCGKGFIAKCHLTVHIRSHTGERPYCCTQCPKSFPTSNLLKRHLFIHYDKKPFQCFKCGKGFTQARAMKMHIRTHKCKWEGT